MFTICIADDEKYVLESIQHRIKQCEMNVKIVGTAQNGKEAFELYEKYKPDIFFVDISMPVCSGLEFMERVRRLDKESTTKFVIISGYDDFEYMKKAIQTGVVNYIMKPVVQEELYDTLNGICNQIDIEKAREKKENQNWIFFDEHELQIKEYSGTIFLILGKNLVPDMKKYIQVLENICGTQTKIQECRYYRFHESRNLVLLMFENSFLNEQGIYKIWNAFREIQETWLVYKVGRNMNLQVIMEEMEITLNTRFWEGTMHVLKSVCIETDRRVDLGNLERAIENTREEEWKREITSIVTHIFERKENRAILKIFYQSVLILIANKYRQHGYEIPENLKEELYPYSLEKCLTRQEIQKKLYEYTRMIHDKIQEKSQRNELVEQVIDYLEYHYAEEINFNELAGEFFIAPNHLYRKFKEKKQMSVMQYLENIRMTKAKELLQDTNLTVTEIASRTGYGDSNYFSRIFKKNYSITPREFRNQQ